MRKYQRYNRHDIKPVVPEQKVARIKERVRVEQPIVVIPQEIEVPQEIVQPQVVEIESEQIVENPSNNLHIESDTI